MTDQTIDPTITETCVDQYPAWQKTIRQGQAYCQQLIDDEKKRWLEAEAVEEAMLGLQLTEALSYFNISVDPLLENRMVLDRIAFSIVPRGEKKELLNRSADALHFDLTVAYQLEEDYERERVRLEEYSLCYTAIAIRHRLDDDDWQQEHSQLADAIDKVTQAAQRFMAQVDGWKAQPVISPLPTLSQQLESLLREIVRDELMKQHDYGYEVE
jgi:hypothetical protein